MTGEDLATVGIIGAGATGRAIAAYLLLGGYHVILEDVSPPRLDEANAQIAAALDAALARGVIDPGRKREIANNLSTTGSMDDALRAADLLIEAAPKDPELQLEIFTIFDKFAKPQAILASTAQSVSIADLAEMTNCPERCVGLRFPELQSPDRSLRILRTQKTSEDSAQYCADFARKLGLEPKILIEPANVVAAVRKAHSP